MKVYSASYIIALVFLSCDSSNSQNQKLPQHPALLTRLIPFFHPLSDAVVGAYHRAIEDYYNKNLVRTGFNGAILVAKTEGFI